MCNIVMHCISNILQLHIRLFFFICEIHLSLRLVIQLLGRAARPGWPEMPINAALARPEMEITGHQGGKRKTSETEIGMGSFHQFSRFG